MPLSASPAARGRATEAGRRAQSRALMWRYMAYQWCMGSTLLALSVAGGTSAGANLEALVVVSVVAYVVAGVMLAVSGRAPESWLHPLLALGNVLIASLVYFSADRASFYALFFVWLNVYAFYFFERRLAWAHTALALASYGGLAIAQSGYLTTRWLLVAGTLVFVGAMVGSLKDRVGRLVDDLAATAMHDPLTGLLNRRGFHELLCKELEHACRFERPLSLIVADIDNFKLINDGFGHEAGDDVLRRVASVLNASHRSYDSVGRMGGEEFALIVPDAEARDAVVLAERLRAVIATTFAGEPRAVTLSLGVAAFPADSTTTEGLLRAADAAMYDAKRLGRDRCELYGRPQAERAPVG